MLCSARLVSILAQWEHAAAVGWGPSQKRPVSLSGPDQRALPVPLIKKAQPCGGTTDKVVQYRCWYPSRVVVLHNSPMQAVIVKWLEVLLLLLLGITCSCCSPY